MNYALFILALVAAVFGFEFFCLYSFKRYWLNAAMAFVTSLFGIYCIWYTMLAIVGLIVRIWK